MFNDPGYKYQHKMLIIFYLEDKKFFANYSRSQTTLKKTAGVLI